MTGFTHVFALALPLAMTVYAAPSTLQSRSVTALTRAQIASYKPYTYYAAAAYCQPAATLAWNCGNNCAANANFKSVASGGGGLLGSHWFVGYDPELDSVIVSHQGTDVQDMYVSLHTLIFDAHSTISSTGILTDADVILTTLDSELFPGVPTDVQVWCL
jgi:hypothetical protein